MRHLHLFTALIFAFAFSPAFSQDEDHTFFSMKEQQLTGPVKSVVLTSFSAKPDGKGGYVKVAPGHQYSWDHDMRIDYNENGSAIAAAKLYPDGRPMNETAFSYANGQLTEIRSFETVQVFEYDDKGRMAIMGERSAASDDEGFYAFTKYEYNDAGQLARTVDLDGEGNWDGGILYTYDATGNLIAMKEDYEDGFTETYTYDDKNRRISAIVKDDFGIQEKTTFVYDGKKTTETWEVYDNGVYSGKIVYTYENGLEVKTVEYDGQTVSETQVTSYTFDSNNNWIRKVVAINGKKFFIEERVIAYY